MGDFISRVKNNKIGFVLTVLSVYLIGYFTSYSQENSVAFALFASAMIFCQKYFIIAMFENGYKKVKLFELFKGYLKLFPVFLVYATVFVSLISICTAFVPEFIPWGEKVLSGISAGNVNDELNLQLESLYGMNLLNAIIAAVVCVILMVYVLFAALTTSVIMFKTNRFVYSLLASFKFISSFWKSYVFVFSPLMILAFAVMYYTEIDLLPFVSVFVVYRIIGLFEEKFGKNKTLI
ncbi:hypothetical protein [Pseudomonas aeruginosa]|uniref:hypothetical protein n=2 Tax=Pseudomonas aeruginosa TaxID=287 RepID=UPI0031B6CC31